VADGLVERFALRLLISVFVFAFFAQAILAMAILAITFDDDKENAGQAAVVPMCYGAFTAWINLVWAMLAWKVFGFTEMPSGSSCFDLMHSYTSSLGVEPAGDHPEPTELDCWRMSRRSFDDIGGEGEDTGLAQGGDFAAAVEDGAATPSGPRRPPAARSADVVHTSAAAL
jgi:hypothetical protein